MHNKTSQQRPLRGLDLKPVARFFRPLLATLELRKICFAKNN